MTTELLFWLALMMLISEILAFRQVRRLRKLNKMITYNLELSKRVQAAVHAGSDYVKHVVTCGQCRSGAKCPIGILLLGAHEEQDNIVERLKMHG
jgi:hypothetical protein